MKTETSWWFRGFAKFRSMLSHFGVKMALVPHFACAVIERECHNNILDYTCCSMVYFPITYLVSATATTTAGGISSTGSTVIHSSGVSDEMVINTHDNINDINLRDTYYHLELKNDISSNTNCIIVMISGDIQGPGHTILE